jgi:uncharacterized protein
VVVAGATLACVPEGAGRFLSIGTGGTGGIYYPLGGALASQLSLADTARQYTAEVTGGSLENVNRVIAGEMDLGFVLISSAVDAYRAEGSARLPGADGLRLVAPLYANVTHVLVGTGSGLSTVGDFRGRRVSVGAPGSGTEQVSRQLLEAAGLTYDDVDVRYLSFRESSDALRDGAIDAAIISVGYPAAAVLEALTTNAAQLIPMRPSEVDTLMARYPYYRRAAIPPGSYPGQKTAIATTGLLNWIVGEENLDSAVVKLVLSTLQERRASLERVHPIAAQIDLEVLRDPVPVPLHSATAQWVAGEFH